MLSRVHHKNLVSLVGLCIDHNEKIVVYEYVPNGTLRESLSGTCNLFTAYFLSVELHASPRFLSVLQSLFQSFFSPSNISSLNWACLSVHHAQEMLP